MEITSIRYVNMDKNWHKNLFMKLLLRSKPYKNFRIPGVKFDNGNNKYDKYLKQGIHPYLQSEDHKNRFNGVVGCWIAHSLALENVTEQHGITVVLEDDFVCYFNFFENALKMVKSFHKDFDIILFDTWGTGPFEMHRISENVYSPKSHSYPYYGGTHCLFVNNAKISKIIESKVNSQVMDYDGFLLASSKLDTFIFYTGDCASRNIGSDITNYNKSTYDLLGIFICLLPHSLREKTAKFKRYFFKLIEIKNWQLSQEELNGFVGYYQYQEQEKINIWFATKDGLLALAQPWGQSDLLFQPISEVDFISKDTLMPVRFTKNKNGQVTAALLNNKNLWQRNNTYEKNNRKEIVLSLEKLKQFEGEYCCKKDIVMIIQIIAMDGYLLGKQLWLGTEVNFFPVSNEEFFDRNYPLFPLRFIRDKEGCVTQIGTFFDLSVFIKMKHND